MHKLRDEVIIRLITGSQSVGGIGSILLARRKY